MLRLTLVTAALFLLVAASPLFTSGRINSAAEIPVYHH
jgi:hypothetical protein